MGEPVVLNHIAFGKDAFIIVGSADGKEQPISSHIVTEYERDNKGPKVINRLTVFPENLTIILDAVLTHYARVLAVDTTKPEEQLPNTVFTGIVLSKVIPRIGGGFELGIYREKVVEIHNLNVPSERYGWSVVCKSIDNLSQEDQVAVIFDSDLRSIPSINKREESILGDFYLPNHF